MAQLDLAPSLQVKQFLGSLDAAGQTAGVRAIICIDAINERHGTDIWPDRLAAFLKMAEPFPYVGVVLSCRSTYVQHVVPDSVGNDRLTRLVHQGFAGYGGEAANIYLAKRGIARPGAPNLMPEFQNPLFLKTCCDFLEKEGRNELPRGLQPFFLPVVLLKRACSPSLKARAFWQSNPSLKMTIRSYQWSVSPLNGIATMLSRPACYGSI